MAYPTNTKHFSSDMPNTPTVYADAGGMVNLLDTLLVTGYGLLPLVSITVTDGVAVANVGQGHSLRKWMVALHAGVGLAALNGEHRAIAASGNTYTFEVDGVPNGVYNGGTTKVAPLGFEISYSSTNRRIYRSLDTARRNAVSLYVNDTNTASGWSIGSNKALAQVKMVCDVVSIDSYVTLDTAWWHKGGAVSGTLARQWNLYGDALGFYSAVDITGLGFAVASNHFMQLNTRALGDQYATMLEGCTPTTGATIAIGGLNSFGGCMTAMAAGTRRIARDLSQTGTAINLRYFGLGMVCQHPSISYGWLTSGARIVAASYQLVGLALVNPADSGIVLGQNIIAAHSPTGALDGDDFTARATMPGMFSVPSIKPWSMVPTILESPQGLEGSNLITLPAFVNHLPGYDATAVGGYYIDITKDWR